MKRIILLVAMATFLILGLGSSTAFAYVMDGNLSDWGVTPFLDWTPDSPTASYTQEDNTNRPGSDPFQERYDLEAMYFDSDSNYLYFAVISSNSYTGDWASEDIGIDLNGDGVYEYGVDTANHSGGFQSKNVYSVNKWRSLLRWNNVDNEWFYVPYRIESGTYLGKADIFNRYVGAIEQNPGPSKYWWLPGTKNTWIIEGRILRSLFGDIACGTPIQLHFARVTCVKDWITVEGCVTGNCEPPIPEPATMLLLGSGLLGLGGMRFRKKRFVSRNA